MLSCADHPFMLLLLLSSRIYLWSCHIVWISIYWWSTVFECLWDWICPSLPSLSAHLEAPSPTKSFPFPIRIWNIVVKRKSQIHSFANLFTAICNWWHSLYRKMLNAHIAGAVISQSRDFHAPSVANFHHPLPVRVAQLVPKSNQWGCQRGFKFKDASTILKYGNFVAVRHFRCGNLWILALMPTFWIVLGRAGTCKVAAKPFTDPACSLHPRVFITCANLPNCWCGHHNAL